MPEDAHPNIVPAKPLEKGKSFFELALGSTTAITGLLFLFGWLHLTEYFAFFDIDWWALDLPPYTPIVYSLLPVLTELNAIFMSILQVAAYLLFFWAAMAVIFFAVKFAPKIVSLSGRQRIMIRTARIAVQIKLIAAAIKDFMLTPLKAFSGEIPQSASPASEFSPSKFRALPFWCVFFFLLIATLVASIVTGKKSAEETFRKGVQVHVTFNASSLSSVDPRLKSANARGDLRLLTQTKDPILVFEKPESQTAGKTVSVFTIKRADISSVHAVESKSAGTGRARPQR